MRPPAAPGSWPIICNFSVLTATVSKSPVRGMKNGLSGEPAGGLWVVEADSVEQAQALVERDPFSPTALCKSIPTLERTRVYANGRKMI